MEWIGECVKNNTLVDEQGKIEAYGYLLGTNSEI
jgi:hypothetical protein